MRLFWTLEHVFAYWDYSFVLKRIFLIAGSNRAPPLEVSRKK